jgi:polar amino acid transport system substrate-binding protein
MARNVILGFAMGCLLCAPSLHARALQICAGETSRTGPGDAVPPVQSMVRRIVEKQGGSVEFVLVPWRRCIDGVRHRVYDGALGAGDNPAFRDFLKFPQKNGQTNPRQGLSNVHYVAVRPVDGAAQWDGRQFTGLTTSILFAAGNAATRDHLEKLQVPATDPSGKPVVLMRMLLKKRNELAVLRAGDVDALLEMPEFAGKLERLSPVVYSVDAYLAIQSTVYEANPSYFDAIWDEIGRVRALQSQSAATSSSKAKRNAAQ